MNKSNIMYKVCREEGFTHKGAQRLVFNYYNEAAKLLGNKEAEAHFTNRMAEVA